MGVSGIFVGPLILGAYENYVFLGVLAADIICLHTRSGQHLIVKNCKWLMIFTHITDKFPYRIYYVKLKY